MRGMQPDDIRLLTAVGDVAVAPGGDRVAYTLTTVDLDANAYRNRLWLADAAGGPVRPVSAGRASDGLPRWSPDGRMLAWAARHEHHTALVVATVVGPGEPTEVCRWPDRITELAWSPHGTHLAFVGRVPDPERYGARGSAERTPAKDMPPRRITRLLARLDGEGWVVDRPTHLHVVPVDGSAPPLALTSGEHPASDLAWSPDGERLAYVSATHDTWDLDARNDVWVVPTAGGVAERLTTTTASWGALAWSPAGDRIAALMTPTPMSNPRHGQLWVLDVGSGERVRRAGGLDRNLTPHDATRPPVWLAGGELLVAAEHEGRLHLLAATETDPDPRTVVGGDLVVRSYDAAGGLLAFAAAEPGRPPELWTAPLAEENSPRRRSDHSATLRSQVCVVEPIPFTAVSADGTEVPCWALPPVGVPEGERAPAVLNIHGGPFTQYGIGFFDEFQLQVGAGLGVVYCNPRGSSGYDEAWGRAIRWPEAEEDPGSGWGGVDFEDVMACIDEAVRRFDWIDPERLGVQGGSYGGYLTSWVVGHTDRFAAAVSERAVNNLVTMEHSSDISGFFRADVGWSHLERPDLYARQSPITYVEAMTTPMLLVHSEEDLRCPIAQAEELFVALRMLGRHAELVRFPAESHGLSRTGNPRHRVMRAEIILEWFTSRLGVVREP
jgi:dipeptidyl aminopeptidase/acylaminoacyl peptidase